MALKNLTVALLLLLTGCAGDTPRRVPADEPPGGQPPAVPPLPAEGPRAVPSLALRLPATGGPLRAYPLPGLGSVAWTSSGDASPVRATIAMDAPGNRLLYRDRTGEIVAFDLVASREHAITPRGHWFTALATDTLLAVSDRGAVIESEPWGSNPWPNDVGGGVLDAFAALGSRLILVRRDSATFATREAGPTQVVPVPSTPIRVLSRNGDALAFGTDSGLEMLEDRDQWRPWFVPLIGSPTDVVFTPSGHELYVSLQSKSELAIVDRFTRKEEPAVPLPGPAAQLRMDPWGRVVLVRPLAPSRRGETWVVGVASGRLLGRIYTAWENDLPTVSQVGSLLYRDGTAVVARDVRTLDSLGAVAGGASDFWFVTRWKPAAGVAAAQAAARRADSAAAAAAGAGPVAGRTQKLPPATRSAAPVVAPAQEPARVAATPVNRAPAPASRVPVTAPAPAAASASRAPAPRAAAPAAAPSGSPSWIQLAVFELESRARDYATELAGEGHSALVVAPAAGAAGWRVLIGPFPSRPAADSVARLLGRPYFITGRGPTGAAPQ